MGSKKHKKESKKKKHRSRSRSPLEGEERERKRHRKHKDRKKDRSPDGQFHFYYLTKIARSATDDLFKDTKDTCAEPVAIFVYNYVLEKMISGGRFPRLT